MVRPWLILWCLLISHTPTKATAEPELAAQEQANGTPTKAPAEAGTPTKAPAEAGTPTKAPAEAAKIERPVSKAVNKFVYDRETYMKHLQSVPVCEIEKFFLPAKGDAISGRTIAQINSAVMKSVDNVSGDLGIASFKDWIKYLLRGMINGLAELEESDNRQSTEILRKFFDRQMEVLFYQVDEYGDYLDEHDKELLRSFRKIRSEENKLLVFCPYEYLETYLLTELHRTNRNYGEFVCGFRKMIEDVMVGRLISMDAASQAYRSIYLAYAEAASNIFLNKYVSGEYLALPIVVAEKLHASIKRISRTYEKLTLNTGPKSMVVAELIHRGLNTDEIIHFLVDRTVSFYYNLDITVYCKLKNQWAKVRSRNSLVNMAFAKFGRPCIQSEERERRKRRRRESSRS